MRMEHFIDAGLQGQVAGEVTGTATDPHGREIPGPR